MIRQLDWRNNNNPVAEPIDSSQAGQSTLLKRFTMIWLAGILILLPMDFAKLPFNLMMVDCWVFIGLPIFWLSFVRGKHIISLSYAVPMWLIFFASFLSTFAAPAPMSSLIVIMKEVYVYIWFITLAAVLCTLTATEFRRILIVWTVMVFLHGLVIIAQFVSPAFWHFTISFGEKARDYAIYRPTGLFLNANANWAAFYQLLGFVPLMLVSPSRKVGMILGLLLLPTMLATGSMGATLAFTVGLTVAVTAMILSGQLALVIKTLAQLAFTVLIFGVVFGFIISQNQQYRDHLEGIFFGRAERSSEGRLYLWQRGIQAYHDNNVFLWGVGPENFREVDPTKRDNQLHNDFLAFSVERGFLGSVGLALFAIVAASRGALLVRIAIKYPDRESIVVVVFLAAIATAMIESLTHQMFHFRELWIILAFQEAMLYKMTSSESAVEPITQPLNRPPPQRHGLIVQPDLKGG